VAVLALYVVYNPGERMPWYYVLPQALLVLGAVCGLFRVLRDQRRVAAVLIVVLGLGAALPETISRAERRIRYDLNYIQGIEPERIAIGRFIHENALPEDRLLTGHGYVARYARIHTYDSTGLNSPEVTRLRAERKYLPDALHPEWIAWHAGLPWDTQREFGYRLERTYYARSARGNPAWRVWHRAPGPLALVADTEDIQGGEIQTGPDRLAVSSISPIRLQLRRDFPVEGLEFGIVRVEDPTTIRVLNGDQVMADRTIPPRDWDEPVTGGSVGFRVDVPDPSLPVEIRVTAADGSPVPKEFIVLEPVWLITRETGAR
jgi:hypothetical protein